MCTLEKRGSIFILTLTGTNDEHRLNPPLLDSIKSALARVRSESSSSSSTALITTAHGKFFSNGYDLAWAKAADTNNRLKLMSSKLRSVVTDLISLPMPTIAAVTGHASAAGCILALSHDYVLMRKDRGFLYMSELDIGLPIISAWILEVIRSKIGSPAARRDVVLRATKVTADKAAEMGVVVAVDGEADPLSRTSCPNPLSHPSEPSIRAINGSDSISPQTNLSHTHSFANLSCRVLRWTAWMNGTRSRDRVFGTADPQPVDGGAEETVRAAVRLGEDLVGRGWDGHVYGQIRMALFSDLVSVLRVDEKTSDADTIASRL